MARQHISSASRSGSFFPGDDDGYRTTCRDTLKTLIDVVGLDDLCTHFCRDAGRQREIALIADHLLTDPGDGHGRHANAYAGIDQLNNIFNRLMLMLTADVDLRGDGTGIQAHGIIHGDGDGFIA